MGITVLDAPPREPEWRSWLYVLLWSLVIFFTIPFARAFRDAVEERIGLGFFVYTTVVIALVGGAVALANIRRRNLPISAHLWLIGVTAAFIAYAYELRDIPEEAIHVAEYGFLGFLVYRALVHRIRDYSIYLVAILIVGTIGMLEEYIQWVVPSRFFDLRDVRTNFVAGALSQVAIAKGLRPNLVQGPPSGASLRRLCQSTALALVVLSVSYLNTPQRVSWYASRIPFLAFLLDSQSDMVDYGYRHHDPEIGAFQSRFSVEELRQLDRQRGAELAEILDRYIDGEGYDAFLKAYSVPRDPYAHEAGVHLFARNRYLERAMVEGETSRPAVSTVAFRENQILERYFPTALRRSNHRWTSETREYVDKHALKDQGYLSRVSLNLITQFSERGVLLAFAVAIGAFVLLGASLSRGTPRLADTSEGQRP